MSSKTTLKKKVAVTVKNLHTGGKLVFTITVVPEYDD